MTVQTDERNRARLSFKVSSLERVIVRTWQYIPRFRQYGSGGLRLQSWEMGYEAALSGDRAADAVDGIDAIDCCHVGMLKDNKYLLYLGPSNA